MTTPITNTAREESPLWPALLLSSMVLLVGIGILMNKGGEASHFDQWKTLLGVIVTLGIFSVLYKENPIFRFLEHVYIGLATGYGVVLYWVNFLYPKWYQAMLPERMVDGGQGKWWLIFTLLLALLFYTVYFPKLAWMNRFALGVLMGWAAGAVWMAFTSMVFPQVEKSFKAPVTIYAIGEKNMNNFPLGQLFGHQLWWHPWAFVFILVLVCALAYFFFSVEHRYKFVRTPANVGRYFIMITLGAIFGTTVMGRFSLAIERLDFLLRSFTEWGHAAGNWLMALFR